jgi:hypothetical protein
MTEFDSKPSADKLKQPLYHPNIRSGIPLPLT